MTDNNSFFPNDVGASPRQQRVAALIDEGFTLAEAQGRTWAEEAGFTPPLTHGVDEASTRLSERDGEHGHDRPRAELFDRLLRDLHTVPFRPATEFALVGAVKDSQCSVGPDLPYLRRSEGVEEVCQHDSDCCKESLPFGHGVQGDRSLRTDWTAEELPAFDRIPVTVLGEPKLHRPAKHTGFNSRVAMGGRVHSRVFGCEQEAPGGGPDECFVAEVEWRVRTNNTNGQLPSGYRGAVVVEFRVDVVREVVVIDGRHSDAPQADCRARSCVHPQSSPLTAVCIGPCLDRAEPSDVDSHRTRYRRHKTNDEPCIVVVVRDRRGRLVDDPAQAADLRFCFSEPAAICIRNFGLTEPASRRPVPPRVPNATGNPHGVRTLRTRRHDHEPAPFSAPRRSVHGAKVESCEGDKVLCGHLSQLRLLCIAQRDSDQLRSCAIFVANADDEHAAAVISQCRNVRSEVFAVRVELSFEVQVVVLTHPTTNRIGQRRYVDLVEWRAEQALKACSPCAIRHDRTLPRRRRRAGGRRSWTALTGRSR